MAKSQVLQPHIQPSIYNPIQWGFDHSFQHVHITIWIEPKAVFKAVGDKFRFADGFRKPAFFAPVGHDFVVSVVTAGITSYNLYNVHRSSSSSHDIGILLLGANHHDIGSLFQYSDGSQSSISANFFSTTTLIFILSTVVEWSQINQNVPKKGDINVDEFNPNILCRRYFIELKHLMRPQFSRKLVESLLLYHTIDSGFFISVWAIYLSTVDFSIQVYVANADSIIPLFQAIEPL